MNKSYGFWRKTSVTIPRKGQVVLGWFLKDNSFIIVCQGKYDGTDDIYWWDADDQVMCYELHEIPYWMYLPPAPKIRIRQPRCNP